MQKEKKTPLYNLSKFVPFGYALNMLSFVSQTHTTLNEQFDLVNQAIAGKIDVHGARINRGVPFGGARTIAIRARGQTRAQLFLDHRLGAVSIEGEGEMHGMEGGDNGDGPNPDEGGWMEVCELNL